MLRVDGDPLRALVGFAIFGPCLRSMQHEPGAIHRGSEEREARAIHRLVVPPRGRAGAHDEAGAVDMETLRFAPPRERFRLGRHLLLGSMRSLPRKRGLLPMENGLHRASGLLERLRQLRKKLLFEARQHQQVGLGERGLHAIQTMQPLRLLDRRALPQDAGVLDELLTPAPGIRLARLPGKDRPTRCAFVAGHGFPRGAGTPTSTHHGRSPGRQRRLSVGLI